MSESVFSVEDGNLYNRPITSSVPRVNSDIDCAFVARPSGDLYKKTDAASVKQAVKNLLMTNHGSVPFKPLYGANLGSLLFELDTMVEESDIKTVVSETLRDHEPRVRLQDCKVDLYSDYNAVNIRVTFEIITTFEVVTLNVAIARTR